MGKNSAAKKIDKKIDKITIKELRKLLGPGRDMTMMIDDEKDYGVVIAHGEGLKALTTLINTHGSQHGIEVTDNRPPAEAEIPPPKPHTTYKDRVETDAFDKLTVKELKASTPENGMEVAIRPGPEEGHYLLVSTAGMSAERLLVMLVGHGLIPNPLVTPAEPENIKA